MKRELRTCLGAIAAAVALTLAVGGTAQADLIGFTYHTTAASTILTGHSLHTTSQATLIETPVPSGSGRARSGMPWFIPVATYTVSSNATGRDLDIINQTITEQVTIRDTASGSTGTFTLLELFSGSVNQANTMIAPWILVLPWSDSLRIGRNIYRIEFLEETYDNRTKTGTIQIGLDADAAAAAPEPSGLTLAGLGALGLLAYARWPRGHAR
jgi:hypothetical protein